MVCLDDYIAGSPEDEVAQLLYGPPIDTHAVNRWFDKFCVIVDPRGMSGANFEHSGFDGKVNGNVLQCGDGMTPIWCVMG